VEGLDLPVHPRDARQPNQLDAPRQPRRRGICEMERPPKPKRTRWPPSRSTPNIAGNLRQLATCLLAERNYDEALAAYQNAIKADKTDATAWRGVGDILTIKADLPRRDRCV